MNESEIRPMRADDWVPVTIDAGRYSNPVPLTGFKRRDGQGGNVLHPVYGDEGPAHPNSQSGEAVLSKTYAALRARYPDVRVARYTVRMPYWTGQRVPKSHDYPFIDAPEPLTTTSIAAVLVPDRCIRDASMGFYFRGSALPALRTRMQGVRFQGIAGNLGYYVTAALIDGKPWAHNARYPAFPLPPILSYIGFHSVRDEATGEIYSSFGGAHPGVVGIRKDGAVDILPQIEIARYSVILGEQRIAVDSIDDPDAVQQNVVLFTPALRTAEVERQIAAAEASAGSAEGWQTYAPMVPLADVERRVNVFIANEGNGRVPVEKVIAVWEGPAPVPSFGAVLSFKRAYLTSLFVDVATFTERFLGQRVQIIPGGDSRLCDYVQMLGGLVPVVVNGEHVYCVDTVDDVMRNLSRYGNANSPIAQAGRETRNFAPYVREPAGVLVRTRDHIGWVLFDGRHELSIGASVVDVAVILQQMQAAGILPAIQQAVFIDGGSAMKAYAVESDGVNVDLDLLNRVAAGSRNRAGADRDGLNLYTLLALRLLQAPAVHRRECDGEIWRRRSSA